MEASEERHVASSTSETHTASTTAAPVVNPTPTPASAGAPPPRQMTREEFLRQMGLAPDDLVERPSASSNAVAVVPPPVDEPALLLPTAGDAPVVIQDDQWVRSTVFTDVSLISAGESTNMNEAKRAILESYKATHSTGSMRDTTDGVDDRRAVTMVTQEDHLMASDYKASLIEEFRKRKKNGESKAPPPVSPPRKRDA